MRFHFAFGARPGFSPVLRGAALLFLSFATAFLANGCCHCKESPSARDAFTIELSSGGGFSGLWSGYIMHSDGAVQFWDGRQNKTESVKTVGNVDPGDIRDIVTLIDKNALMALPLRETGNMTCMLRVTRGELTSFITWPGTLEDDAQVPAEARGAVRALLNLLAKFRTSP
jgi:hypothetical protein